MALNEHNPHSQLRLDRTLQSLVNKIIRNLRGDEEARQRQFEDPGGAWPPARPPGHAGSEPPRAGKLAATSPQPKAEPAVSQRASKRLHTGTYEIDFRLELVGGAKKSVERDEHGEPISDLDKPFIRTKAQATIAHIKQFLAIKLGLSASSDQYDILCKGEVLGKEHTLEFVKRSRWREDSLLILNYRPRVNYDV